MAEGCSAFFVLGSTLVACYHLSDKVVDGHDSTAAEYTRSINTTKIHIRSRHSRLAQQHYVKPLNSQNEDLGPLRRLDLGKSST